MNIYGFQEAFGSKDKTTSAMRNAVKQWYSLYYADGAGSDEDTCQRIAYTIVNKLVRAVFGEYTVTAEDPTVQSLLEVLSAHRQAAVQHALVGGECYLKPWVSEMGFGLSLIPRDQLLIFARDPEGKPTDVGTAEVTTLGNHYYTLLERRYVDPQGYLTMENRLYRSLTADRLGNPCPLTEHPAYSELTEKYTYSQPVGSVGLVRLKTPMLNCVDGSPDGVAVYAAAVELIRNINRNEAQLCGEFARGESRIIASADLLDENKELNHHLFVGLDDDPEHVGLTVFSPALREQSFLARKQEYLRNVESILGLRRGLLSDANMEERTATEISSSQGEYNLTVMDFQGMWEQAVKDAVHLCAVLAQLYQKQRITNEEVSFDWGNGVLYDEEKTWADYKEMVRMGMLKPEVALGWRFGAPAVTEADRQKLRQQYVPE